MSVTRIAGIAFAIVIIALVIYLAYDFLAYRRKKAQQIKEADEAAAKVDESSEAAEPAGAVIEIPGSNPMQELTKLPEVTDSSVLPEEAKSILMNAVWYRCENPKCNYTQFLEVYHIVPEDKGGTNILDNLVILCPQCRFAAYSAELTEEELHSWVKERVERFKFAIDWPYK